VKPLKILVIFKVYVHLPEGIMNVIFHVIEWVLNWFSSKKQQWYLFSIQDAWHFPSKIGV